ncbi:MAG: hypothetical protein DELT_00618 [Desulfovibrio sp.]
MGLALDLIDAYSYSMNELLDLLEQRVLSLADEMSALQRENSQLRRDLTEKTGSLAEENLALQEALAREKAARETAAERINALLQRLTDRTQA